MKSSPSILIAGLGAMGSAAAYHLARRGAPVRGFDRFAPPHTMGSSHGQSRIIREAYFEDPVYVPMVRRAYELWRELERESGSELLLQTGGLMFGRPDSQLVAGARASAERYGLRHDVLSIDEIARRFPPFRPDPDMIAVHEPRAGLLYPEACIRAHLAGARAGGAQLHLEEPVTGWEAGPDSVTVRTAKGRHSADLLILSAGAWASELLAPLAPPLRVERQVAFWFEPRALPDAFLPAHCPVHLWNFDDGRFAYGFPDLGTGVKIARHGSGVFGSPDGLSREVAAEEVEDIRAVLRRFLPDADGAFRSAAACLYTNTPDEHFWIDRHPQHANVLIASPCSGHGFKFASVVGEILADLATRGEAAFDLAPFRNRWSMT